MAQHNIAAKLRAALGFLVVSVVAGILAGAMSVPMLLVGTSMINTTEKEWSLIPLDLVTPPQAEGSSVYMADGSLLTTFADENRKYVPMSEISTMMQHAQVAIEDKRFYDHGAVDFYGLVRAAVSNFTGNSDQGASSITQQYVKMVRIQIAQQNDDPIALKAATEQTISRKIIEMRYAMAVEKQLTKDQILERYLNMAYYGDQVYGVEAAAQHYFGVSAIDLDLPQAAMIAGLVQSPGVTDPVNNPISAVARRNLVIDRMALPDVGYISTATAEMAKAVPWDPKTVKSQPSGCAAAKYPFICDYVKTVLLSDAMSSLGSTRQARSDALYRNGLKIQTVINPSAQDSAQKAVSKLIDPRDPVVGVVVLIQPSTGLILAMAQSRYKEGSNTKIGETFWNWAVGGDMGGPQGFQAGSTFKTFTIANALSMGVPLSTMYETPSPLNVTGQRFIGCNGPYRVGQYSVRGGSGKPIDLLTATANSVNTYFIQLERDTSVCGAVKMAQAAGVKSALAAKDGGYDLIKDWAFDQKPSFTLGTVNVAPLTMAAAFATFANKGKHCDPIMIKSVTTKAGEEVPVPSANCKQTINANVAAGVVQAQQGVMSRGTGSGNRIAGGYPQAGKSGTTNNAVAVAFGGYTPNVAGFATIGVDPKDPSGFWNKGYWKTHKPSMSGLRLPYSKTYLQGFGAQDAGRIWQAAMTAAVRNTPKTGFPAFHPLNTGWHSPYEWTPTPTPPKTQAPTVVNPPHGGPTESSTGP